MSEITGGKLLSGQSLRPGQTLVSVGGHARLHYQEDGNLVVYLDGNPFWASHTDGYSAGRLLMRQDGNLVISDATHDIASTQTNGHPRAMVQLQDDGNFVIYEDPNGPLAGTPIWASSTGAFTIGHVAPDETPVTPGHRTPAGLLRLENRTFVDDNGPFLGGFISYFHGVRTFVQNRARFDEDAATMRACGVDAPRVITDLGWPVIDGVNKEWNGPANVDALVAMVDHLYDAYGIRTQVVLLGSLMGATYENNHWEQTWPYRLDNQPARLQYADQVTAALRSRAHKVALIEVCNEPENPSVGPLSRPDQAELQRRMKQAMPSTLVCLGAPGGDMGSTSWDSEDYHWYGDHGDMALPHLDRGRRDCVQNGVSTTGAGEAYGHIHQGIHSAQDVYSWNSNEPIGPRSSVESESDPTRLRMGATATWMCRGAAHVFHPYSGIGLAGDSDYPISLEPGIQHVFDARKVLPANLPAMQFHNWHWTSNPFEALEGCLTDVPGTARGAIRNLACTGQKERVIQIIKVGRDGARYRMRERMHLTRYEHDGNEYVGREQRDYAQGEVIELPAAEEYLFVGEVR